jgi:hypothetical protein
MVHEAIQASGRLNNSVKTGQWKQTIFVDGA